MECKYFREQINDIANDIEELYSISSVGGCLHIVVDDDNLEDYHIQWCIDNANPNDDDYEIGMKIAKNMLNLSMKERMLMSAKYNNDWCYCEQISKTHLPLDCKNCFIENESFECEIDDNGDIHWI